MSFKTERMCAMFDILPDEEQDFALELMRRLILAWDPDFTKQTPAEAEHLREAIQQMNRGEYAAMSDIDWE